MKGVTFITDDTHKKRFVQIELDEIKKHEELLQDIFDVIIAESRKDEEKIPLEEVKRQLKQAGKL